MVFLLYLFFYIQYTYVIMFCFFFLLFFSAILRTPVLHAGHGSYAPLRSAASQLRDGNRSSMCGITAGSKWKLDERIGKIYNEINKIKNKKKGHRWRIFCKPNRTYSVYIRTHVIIIIRILYLYGLYIVGDHTTNRNESHYWV